MSTDSNPGPLRRRISPSTVFVVVLVLVGGVLGAREAQRRITHVHETDARIAADLVTVSSRVPGWLTGLHVREGDQVVRDQVLIVVDDRISRLLVEELEAGRRGVGAERERLVAERRLVDERTRSHLETRGSSLSAAEAFVAALDPQLELARSELERARSLFDKRVIPKQALDQARAAAQRIEGEHRAGVAHLAEARAEVVEAQAERARLEVLDREIDKLVHQEQELAGRVEQQRMDVADRTLRSLIDGVVDRVFVENGEYVRPGQRLVMVHDPGNVWVEANVKETQVRKLTVGQLVEIAVDAYPDEPFRGEVSSIGQATTASFALLPNPNPSGNFTKITQRLPVRIALGQQDRRLRPGMMVEVRIDVRGR